MSKTEQLMKMLEHPERYTEQQWQDILADGECRELYSLMAKTRSALAGEQADEHLTDEMIAEQWQRLEAEQHEPALVVPLWRKVAAAVAVVVASVGIAIAAVHAGFFSSKHSDNRPEQVVQQGNSQENTVTDEVQALSPDTLSMTAGPRLFEEVPLEQILAELAPHYGVEVEYRSDDVRSLRLFYQWEPEYSLDKVVEMLNNFEAFSIHREGDRLIVESTASK